MRVSLTEEDFEALVNGGVVTKTIWRNKHTLEIALEDIGFLNMKHIVELATLRSLCSTIKKKKNHNNS